MKNDEFEFLWEKSQEYQERIQKLEQQVLDIQEAINKLIEIEKTTQEEMKIIARIAHNLDMRDRPIGPVHIDRMYGPGYSDYGRKKIFGDTRGSDGKGI